VAAISANQRTKAIRSRAIDDLAAPCRRWLAICGWRRLRDSFVVEIGHITLQRPARGLTPVTRSLLWSHRSSAPHARGSPVPTQNLIQTVNGLPRPRTYKSRLVGSDWSMSGLGRIADSPDALREDRKVP
jgi:hypothetical protein